MKDTPMPSFAGLKVGDKVFVAHQARGGKRKTETVQISKVGRKYLYVQIGKRDQPFDPKSGHSVHKEHNMRSNGWGFDVFCDESWYLAEQQHLRNVSALRKSLDWISIGKITPSQAKSILEILGL
jgi:hypothetical protein